MTRTRHDWTAQEIEALMARPLADLVFEAQKALRAHFEPNRVQLSTLLSVKTGGCPEDCRYCAQSIHYATPVEPERMLDEEEVLAAARRAKERGATRFCMSAAWREPPREGLRRFCDLIRAVKALGLETCATLGMLTEEQARALKDAGLDYYNHNIDCAPDFYEKIITTRRFEDRLNTLRHVRKAGLHVCSGGIVGMGESRRQRAAMLAELARMEPHPESVPINLLVKIPGTPLDRVPELDPFELVRTIAAARIAMPASWVRLSAGREQMSDELQALCFLAGANSVFYGEKLLTAPNAAPNRDAALFARLGLAPEAQAVPSARRIAEATEESCSTA